MWSQFIAIFNYAIQQNNRNGKSSWDMLKNRVSNLQIHWIFFGHTERFVQFVTGPTNRFIQFFKSYLQTYPVCYQSNLLLSNLSYLQIYPICYKSNLQTYPVCYQSNLLFNLFPVILTDLSNLFPVKLTDLSNLFQSYLEIYPICSKSNLQICPICSLWGNCIELVGLFQKTL